MPKKQTELAGMEGPSIPEIEQAAEAYVKARDSRMRLTEKEITAKTKLIQVVLEHEKELSSNPDGEKIYRYDDEMVILKPGKRNVKVKAVHEDEEQEDED